MLSVGMEVVAGEADGLRGDDAGAILTGVGLALVVVHRGAHVLVHPGMTIVGDCVGGHQVIRRARRWIASQNASSY